MPPIWKTRALCLVSLITLRTYQNQIVEQKVTDRNGLADFSAVKSDVFYIEAEKDGQRSFIKPGDMAWNLSTFDTGGQDPAPDGIRAFFYTERGVYRPGDDIYLSAIVRNHNHTFPDGHPVSLAFYNPLGQRVLTQTNREGKDGFYTFDLSTSADAPTGNWRAEIDVGSRKFNHRVKVETIVPFRLKVFLDPQLAERDHVLKADLRSTYLFGNPAAGLKANVDVTLHSSPPVFPRYEGFSFVNQAVNFKPITTNIFTGALDEEGKAAVSWELPSLSEAPSRLSAIPCAHACSRKAGDPIAQRAGYISIRLRFMWGCESQTWITVLRASIRLLRCPLWR